jgi:ferritin
MISKQLTDAINIQINEELSSAYLYLSMSAFAEGQNLKGFANWFYIQYQEELDHAMGFFHFLIARGGNVVLKAIAEPQVSFSGPEVLFREGLKHEQYITACIHRLYELSVNEKDYALTSFLKWYIDEQVEEEESATSMVEKIDFVGTKGHALYLLDKELSGRKYEPLKPTI